MSSTCRAGTTWTAIGAVLHLRTRGIELPVAVQVIERDGARFVNCDDRLRPLPVTTATGAYVFVLPGGARTTAASEMRRGGL